MEIHDIPVATLAGEPSDLSALRGKVSLIVNVASRCGLTPQYAGLERLQEKYGAEGFSVVGFPCNQFAGQEPGTSEEIATFCSTTYGVSFPLYEKVEVNGPGRHPVYQELVRHPDADGAAGDVQWNFEKFLVSRDGQVLARFRPRVEPEDAAITEAIEAALRQAG
jgi:glutathione peroxidase